MNEISIDVKNLSKVYKLYETAGHRLKEAFNLFGKKYHKDFTALENINLQINKGETFSLIGKNGAGKSTLLKVLSGVVSPTTGSVTVNGRIVALLELGAGFNPEMSGVENVYLFGAFHGLSRVEMETRFTDIVTFADIGEFINYPVKTYSSGMFVRLAFACSIHLEPDILVVDEALSVGDARFQQKCFKFIEELKEKGTTIVLVSHDLSLIKMVSQRACLIDHGRILMVGSPKDVANMYFDLDSNNQITETSVTQKKESSFINIDESLIKISPGDLTFGEGVGAIRSVDFRTNGSFPFVSGNDRLSFSLNAIWSPDATESLRKKGQYLDNLIFGVSMSDRYGNYIFGMTSVDKEIVVLIEKGEAIVTFELPMPQLKSDDYLLNVSLALGTQAHHVTIAWYEVIHIIKYHSKLKNVYGWMHPDYSVIK